MRARVDGCDAMGALDDIHLEFRLAKVARLEGQLAREAEAGRRGRDCDRYLRRPHGEHRAFYLDTDGAAGRQTDLWPRVNPVALPHAGARLPSGNATQSTVPNKERYEPLSVPLAVFVG